ncbi:MAG: DUF1365 family protein [Granulosicoccus sp.]|nr:DUF1365 family protein [Granulosicoccus sp.]
MSFKSRLYAGQVYHKRTRPREHTLRYSVFTLLLDLDEIEHLASRLWLFSHNRFNLFSFYDSDFGDQSGRSLSEFVHARLSEAGIHEVPARILLSCYPRVAGFAFNPLSLFYCLDTDDRCVAVIHEVHNTFGERHCYVLPVKPDAATTSDWIHQRADKALFVSPFAQLGMHYQFRLNMPDDRQVVVIRASDDEGLLITASYTAVRKPLTAARLGRYFLTCPLLGVKVVLGIHWEALRLWCKGVPWFRHQPKRQS